MPTVATLTAGPRVLPVYRYHGHSNDLSEFLFEVEVDAHALSDMGVLDFKEGTLYPLLHKMQGQRLIKAKWEDGPAGKPRKYYALTPKGTRLLGDSREQWTTLSTAVHSPLMGA